MLCPMVTTQAFLTEQGLEENHIEYFVARGLKSVALFARAAVSDQQFLDNLITPFLECIEIKGTKYQTTDDPVAVQALVMLV